jgi:hypothetical protein
MFGDSSPSLMARSTRWWNRGLWGLPRVWLTFFVPGVAGPEGCRDAEEVPA